MPFMEGGKRSYKKERQWEKENGDKRGKQRSLRNQARRKLGLAVGDPREVDHRKPLSSGGGNGKSNLRVVSRKTNATKEAKRKKTNGN